MKIRLLRPVFKMKTDMPVDKAADFIKTPLFRRASGQKEKPQTVGLQAIRHHPHQFSQPVILRTYFILYKQLTYDEEGILCTT